MPCVQVCQVLTSTAQPCRPVEIHCLLFYRPFRQSRSHEGLHGTVIGVTVVVLDEEGATTIAAVYRMVQRACSCLSTPAPNSP